MTYYQILEVPEGASAADVRSAYRRLVLATHPDRTPDPVAHARYLAINAAYEVLNDPNRRAIYDNTLFTSARNFATNQARTSRPPIRKQQLSSTYNSSYSAIYLKHASLGRIICKVLLGFGLLLCIDRIWILNYPKEPVVNSPFYSSKRGSYCIVETPHANFRGQCFDVGEVLALRRTALFGQVLSVCLLKGGKEVSSDCYENISFLYDSGGVLFPITMLVTAAVGMWPGRAGRRQVDCATAAGVLAIIIMLLLAIS